MADAYPTHRNACHNAGRWSDATTGPQRRVFDERAPPAASISTRPTSARYDQRARTDVADEVAILRELGLNKRSTLAISVPARARLRWRAPSIVDA
jgi:hypothetical protein